MSGSLPIPPPSRRHGDVLPANDMEALGLAVARLHEHLWEGARVRASTDFRPVPSTDQRTRAARVEGLLGDDAVPACLETTLASTLSRRLQQVLVRLRRRLARTRRELPLPRLREQDPACLRHNARRPGLTLLEKAGPRQTLRGVVREPRFDTVENRVLKRAAERLSRRTRQGLHDAPPRGSTRGQRLRRLGAVAQQALEHPELAEVRRPRPGDRPTNALLHDADYRAAWRYLRRLDEAERAFPAVWCSLESAWRQCVVLALWGLLDGDEAWLAEPVRLSGQADSHGDGFLPLRRWVKAGHASLQDLCVTSTPDVVQLRLRTHPEAQERVVTWRTALPWSVDGDAEDLRGLLRPRPGSTTWSALRDGLVADLTTTLHAGDLAVTARWASPPRRPDRVALDATDLHLRAVADGHADLREAVVLAPVPGDSGAQPAPLWAHGQEATLLPDAVGPALLWRGEHLPRLAARLAQHTGRRTTALVVPNGADERQLAALQAHLPGAWLVWHPVACALAAAHTGLVALEPGVVGTLVVVTAVAATTEITLLELEWREQDRGLEPRWIRSWPRDGALPGLTDGLDAAELAARLRSEESGCRWVRDGSGWRPGARDPLRPLDLGEALARAMADDPAAAWLGVLAVGDVDMAALRRATDAPVVTADPDLAVRGAEVFLTRHAAGLPTWADRRPDIALTVKVDQREQAVPLFGEARRLVEPGERIRERSDSTMVLSAGESYFSWQVQRRGRRADFILLAEGGPLPLGSPTTVQVDVDFVYGSDALRVALVPIGPATFSRLPLTLVTDAEAGERLREDGPPPAPGVRSIVDARDVARWVREVDKLVDALGASKQGRGRQRRGTQTGREAEEARRIASELMQDLKERLQCTSPDGLEADLRERLLQQAVMPVEGLLGLQRMKRLRALGSSHPFAHPLWRLRASLRIRAEGADPIDAPQELETTLRIRVLALTLDGRADAQLDLLADLALPRHHEASEWCRGLAEAIRADVRLAHSMTETQVLRLWSRLQDVLGALLEDPNPEKRRRDLARAFQLVPLLLQARVAGHLGVDSPEVAAMRDLLEEAERRLPPDALTHREAGDASDDVPLLYALRCLDGVYTASARGDAA